MMQIYYSSEGTSGETLSTLDKTMIALNMMSSDQFQRSGAIIGGVTQPTVSRVLVQFSKAVNEILRPDVLHLPTEERMRKNEKMLKEKYHLPGFAFGVDGVLVNFDSKPWGLPAHRTAQSYFSRKHIYAINAMVCIL